MVNTNVDSPIVLPGKGFTYKPNGSFLPGEYRRLKNVEISDDGFLKPRRRVTAIADTDVSDIGAKIGDFYPKNTSPSPGPSAVLLGWNNSVTLVTKEGAVYDWPYWAGVNGRYPCGFIAYNNYFYWIYAEWTSASDSTLEIKVNKSTSKAGVQGGSPLGDTFAGAASTTTVLTESLFNRGGIAPFDAPENKRGVGAYTLFKNRLWLSFESVIYFSEVGNLVNFTAPAGGFIDLRDADITALIPYRDMLIAFTKNSIYSITYSSDPNNISDISVVKISNDIGADNAIMYRDQVVFYAASCIYRITNNYVEKLMDVNLGFEDAYTYDQYGNAYFKTTVFGWENYLIVHHWDPAIYPAGPPNAYQQNGYAYAIKDYRFSADPNVFWINMDTGAVHEFDYRSGDARAIEFFSIPQSDDLFVVCNNFAAVSPEGHVGRITKSDEDVLDHGLVGGSAFLQPHQLVEVDSFVPDGHEYLVKRFKNLLVEGRFPSAEECLNLTVDYDRTLTYTADPINLLSASNVAARFPDPIRIGLNARGRALSVKLEAELATALTANDLMYRWQINDLRVYWTYTGRAPDTRTA